MKGKEIKTIRSLVVLVLEPTAIGYVLEGPLYRSDVTRGMSNRDFSLPYIISKMASFVDKQYKHFLIQKQTKKRLHLPRSCAQLSPAESGPDTHLFGGGDCHHPSMDFSRPQPGFPAIMKHEP